MIHTANEFTKIHHRHLLSGFAAGLHPLPAGSVVEAPTLPHRSTRSATAQQHQVMRAQTAVLRMNVDVCRSQLRTWWRCLLACAHTG